MKRLIVFLLLVQLFCYTGDFFLKKLMFPPFKITILCYHTFVGNNFSYIDFSLSELETQIIKLRDFGYRFITYNDIIKEKLYHDKNILIVIDDGHKSGLEAYNKVFKKYNILPMFAVPTFLINRNPVSLTWEQLRYLNSEGCEIVSHGYKHRFVNKYFWNTQQKTIIKEEFKKSFYDIMNHILTVPRVYVYPFGVYHRDMFSYLRESGYLSALALGQKPTNSEWLYNYEIKRIMLTRSNYASYFK